MSTCFNCSRELCTVTEQDPCDDCMYIHDEAREDSTTSLDFNKEQERVYQPDVYEEAQRLQDLEEYDYE